MAEASAQEMNTEEWAAVANGVRLHVRQVGRPAASPVMFLHGIMGHRRDWDVFIDRLGETYRVIAPDQRGHGRSEWTRTYRVSDMADDAIALVEHLGLGSVPIVGHSMGAMVGLFVAARRPDLVERLVVVDVVPGSMDTPFAAQMPDMFEAMATASYATVADAVAEWQAENPLAHSDLLHNYVTHALVRTADGRLRWGFDARGLRAFPDGVTSDELWDAIDATTCPCLIVRGQHSPITTPREVAEVARHLGGAPVVEIAAGGHDLGVEQPEAVAAAVLGFLSAHEPHEERRSPLSAPKAGLGGC